MPKKTDKSLVLLNFDDLDNPWKDECGYIWTPHGKVHLEYDHNIGKNVACFDLSTMDFIRTNVNFTFGDNDFSIDGTCYLNKNTIKIRYNRIFELTTEDNKRMQLVRAGREGNDTFILAFNFMNYNTKILEAFTEEQFKEQWFHYSLVYDSKTYTFKIFINSKLCLEKIYKDVGKYPFKYLTLGASKTYTDIYTTGKMGYFRIEENVLDPPTIYGFTIEL